MNRKRCVNKGGERKGQSNKDGKLWADCRSFPRQSARENYIFGAALVPLGALVGFALVALGALVLGAAFSCAKLAPPRTSPRPRAMVINFFMCFLSPLNFDDWN